MGAGSDARRQLTFVIVWWSGTTGRAVTLGGGDPANNFRLRAAIDAVGKNRKLRFAYRGAAGRAGADDGDALELSHFQY